MRTFGADMIIISTHPEGRSNWLERGVVSGARQRFEVRSRMSWSISRPSRALRPPDAPTIGVSPLCRLPEGQAKSWEREHGPSASVNSGRGLMSAKKRQQTMAKFMREQAVREKRMLKRQRKEEAAGGGAHRQGRRPERARGRRGNRQPVEAHADRS